MVVSTEHSGIKSKLIFPKTHDHFVRTQNFFYPPAPAHTPINQIPKYTKNILIKYTNIKWQNPFAYNNMIKLILKFHISNFQEIKIWYISKHRAGVWDEDEASMLHTHTLAVGSQIQLSHTRDARGRPQIDRSLWIFTDKIYSIIYDQFNPLERH